MWVEFRRRAEVGTHGQVMKISAHRFQVMHVGNGVGGVAVLPDWKVCVEAISEAVLDEFNRMLERDGLRREYEVQMIGHHNVGMQLVVPQGAVMKQRVDEEIGNTGDFEGGTAIASCYRDEGHTGTRWTYVLRHESIVGGPYEGVNPTKGVLYCMSPTPTAMCAS